MTAATVSPRYRPNVEPVATAAYRMVWTGQTDTPDLMRALQEALERAKQIELVPDPHAVDDLLAWARDPDSLDWDHLEQIDREGWRLTEE